MSKPLIRGVFYRHAFGHSVPTEPDAIKNRIEPFGRSLIVNGSSIANAGFVWIVIETFVHVLEISHNIVLVNFDLRIRL